VEVAHPGDLRHQQSILSPFPPAGSLTTPQRLGRLGVITYAPSGTRTRYLLVRRHVQWRLSHVISLPCQQDPSKTVGRASLVSIFYSGFALTPGHDFCRPNRNRSVQYQHKQSHGCAQPAKAEFIGIQIQVGRTTHDCATQWLPHRAAHAVQNDACCS